MPSPLVTVVIPTLAAGENLRRCLQALGAQTFTDFETVVVDNSGQNLAQCVEEPTRVRVILNPTNVGFGRAINQAVECSQAEFVATLNDDAYPAARWLESLLGACRDHPDAGMFASQIRLRGRAGELDSAGLGIYGDGTTKQRGHRMAPEAFGKLEEVLLPSGCAALYRRSVLDSVGGFDADYFLYGEDADLGLRARLRGWSCLYVPDAVVEHEYSLSAGRASDLKAYYIERNRLFTLVKIFPLFLWFLVPWYSVWRYLAHFQALVTGQGLAGEYAGSGRAGWRLLCLIVTAHWGAFRALPELIRKRRLIRREAVLNGRAFWKLLRRYRISARVIAAQ